MKARIPQGMGGGPQNMNQMIRQAQKMQEDMAAFQSELEEKEFKASVGGGAVEITMNGKREVKAVSIKPEVVDPEDVEMLEDLIASAVNEVLSNIETESSEGMSKITGRHEYAGSVLMAESGALPLTLLAEQFARLPGIGMKTAQRLAYFVMSMSDEEAQAFAKAILYAHKTVHSCSVCQNLTDKAVCPICSDDKRDHATICVVENPKDVAAFERTREYNGVYHVLHGLISPIDGITPDKLRINELLARISKSEIKEVIMATNPTPRAKPRRYIFQSF